jgi:ABC-2 type transport system ATP-binding protein
MPIALSTTSLCRTFKSYEKPEGLVASIRGFWDRKYTEKTALHPTTLEIESGQIVGLVGANGAGKTTLLKMLSGLVHPTSGDAQVLGFRPWERNNDFLRKMSILLGQKNQLWWDISPLDSFSLLAKIYDLDHKQAQLKVQELASMLDCTSVLKTQLRRLSLGERMKMEIIGALLHNPEILFLDEPTIGLDIVAQTSIRQFLADHVRNQGPTVILTSHYMDDIAKLADRLLLISKGSIVYDGTVPGFVAKSDNRQTVSFSLSQAPAQDVLLEADLVIWAGQQSHSLQVATKDLPRLLSQVTALPSIHDLKIEEADFEEIIHSFLQKESRVLSAGDHLKS